MFGKKARQERPKVSWEDIPEEDREWISPEAMGEMLDRFPELSPALDEHRKVQAARTKPEE